jgi:DNA-binding MarR family transcriptional regulator
MCSARISEYGGSMTKADRVRASVLDEQLCFALYTASRAMTGCYRPMLDALGLTYPQFLVLLVLWERGDTSVTGIGNALQLETGTLSPLLKRLEATGFITRTRQAEDERSVVVGLTEAGRDVEERVAAVQNEVSDATGLTEPEIVALRATLHTLTANLRNPASR